MELLCCLCVNMHWSVFSCVSPPPPHLRVWIYMYIRLNLEKERQRARETKWHRERKETSVDFPSRDRGVPLGSLSGTLGFDAAPAASSHTDCYALRYVRGQTLADYMDCDCESIFKEKSSKKNLWCSLCFISSALTQKAIMMSELAEARPVSPRGHFCQLLFGSV